MDVASIARQQLACLGDASRFRIVTELTAGQACVTELAGRIGLSQSCTTRHLQALLRAGLVTRERAGRRVLFAVRSQDPAVRSLLDWKSRLEADGDLPGPAGPRASDGRARRRPAGRTGGGRASEPPGTVIAGGPDPVGRADEGPAIAGRPESAGTPAPEQAGDPAPGGALKGESDVFVRPTRAAREDLEDFLL